MKLFTIERLTNDMIDLLIAREDSNSWADHGGAGPNLKANILRNIKMVETGYMQDIDDAARSEHVYKAFRLGMYGVLVDIWKELLAMSKGDYDFMRRWSLEYHLAAASAGAGLTGVEPFILFGDMIKCSNQHYLSKNAVTLEQALNALRRSFATMTKETNATGTKERAKAEIFKLLKANPLLQFTFLEQALIPSVLGRVTAGESPMVRGILLDDIFNQLIAGENVGPVTDNQFCKHVKSELERGGYFIFDTAEALDMFTAWAKDNKIYPDDMKMIVHSSELDATKQNIVFSPGAIDPIKPGDIQLMLKDVLDYSSMQAALAAGEITMTFNPEETKKEEAVKPEQYVHFMGTDHLVGELSQHGTAEFEANYILGLLQDVSFQPVTKQFLMSYIHRSEHQRVLAGLFLKGPEMTRLDVLDARQRSMVLERAIEIALRIRDNAEDIFDIVGAKGKAIPGSIYADTAGSVPRNEVDVTISVPNNPTDKEEKPTMKILKGREEKPAEFADVLREILTIRAQGVYPGVSDARIKEVVDQWMVFIRSSIQANPNINVAQLDELLPKGAESEPAKKPITDESIATAIKRTADILRAANKVTEPKDEESAVPFSGIEKFLTDLGVPLISKLQHNPQHIFSSAMIHGQPANPANAYAKMQEKVTIQKVTTTETVTLSNGVQFHIYRDTETKQLTITLVSCSNNYGQNLVSGTYADKDADYIIASLFEGIEAGHPHKAVLLAVQRVGSAGPLFGLDYTPGFGNGF